MRSLSALIAFSLLAITIVLTPATNVHAALPCNLNDPIYSTEFSDEPIGDVVTQTMVATFEGVGPADREDAEVIDYDTPEALRFRVVSAGENILRCLDYGQSEVLAINATPGYRFSHFGLGNDIPEEPLITDLDATSVYTERVDNPMKLTNGLYLVDFTARHNDLWLSGEMVFEMVDDDDLYLSSTYLAETTPANGESHNIIADDEGVSVASITVRNGDLIGFGNERDDSIRVVVTSDDSGEVVFHGGNLGKHMAGPAPKSAFFVQNLDPGEYTATITTDSDEQFTVQITVTP